MRKKDLPLHVYIDSQKYSFKVECVKSTIGLTRFIESCLDKYQVDETTAQKVQQLIDIKEGLKKDRH